MATQATPRTIDALQQLRGGPTGGVQVAKSTPKSTRQRLLAAAYELVNRLGPEHLNLDAIAEEAGVTRGSLLYHFRDREAIMTGLIARALEGFDDRMRRVRNEQPGAGAFTRAYVDTLQRMPPNRVTASIACAALQKPALLDAVRTQREAWTEQIQNDGIDPVDATLLSLSAEGLWLTELLGLSQITPEMRQVVVKRMTSDTRD